MTLTADAASPRGDLMQNFCRDGNLSTATLHSHRVKVCGPSGKGWEGGCHVEWQGPPSVRFQNCSLCSLYPPSSGQSSKMRASTTDREFWIRVGIKQRNKRKEVGEHREMNGKASVGSSLGWLWGCALLSSRNLYSTGNRATD